MKKKVVVLTSAHLASDVRIYEKEARSLAKKYDVTLVAPVHESFEPDGVTYIPLGYAHSRSKRMMNIVRCVIHAIRIRPAVVHIHDPELLPGVLPLRWLFGVRLVYDVHENQHKGILDKAWLPTWLRSIILFLFANFESFAMRWVDGLVLAEYSYGEIYNGKCNNIQFVRNYPIVTDDVVVHSEERNREGGEATLAYIGAIQKERGIYEMIELIRVLEKSSSRYITMDLMGGFESEALKTDVTALVKHYNLRDRIIYHGRLSYGDVLQRLKSADIGLAFLHPTDANVEILPTKLFDYMMMKIPVAVMELPNLMALVRESDCGIAVNAFNPDETAKKILELLENPVQRETMGMNGYKSIKGKYNWSNEEKKLLKLYNTL